MAQLRIRLTDDVLLCEDGRTVTRKPLGSGGLDRMKGWITAYDAAVRARQTDRLSAIGQDIAMLLHEGDGWLDDRLTLTGPLFLEIQAAHDRDEGARILLDVPWELLAPGGRFLAAPPHRLFLVADIVHAADVQDRDGASMLIASMRQTYPWLRQSSPMVAIPAQSSKPLCGRSENGPWRSSSGPMPQRALNSSCCAGSSSGQSLG